MTPSLMNEDIAVWPPSQPSSSGSSQKAFAAQLIQGDTGNAEELATA